MRPSAQVLARAFTAPVLVPRRLGQSKASRAFMPLLELHMLLFSCLKTQVEGRCARL